MQKIVISNCHGGYGLSKECLDAYNAKCGTGITKHWEIDRDDPVLVELVERMGDAANGEHAELVVLEIPDNVLWTICDYDGREWIAEKHRTWHADAWKNDE